MGIYIGSNKISSANVFEVTSANLTTLNVTPSTSAQNLTPTGNVDGWDEVNVSAVTSSIDANITAGNIKDGVSILGVTGNYTGSGSAPVNYRLPWDPNNTNLVTSTLTVNVTIVSGVYILFYVDENCDTVYQTFSTTGTYNLTVLAGSWMVGFVYNSEGNNSSYSNITNINSHSIYGTNNPFYGNDVINTWFDTYDSQLMMLNQPNGDYSTTPISYSFSVTVDDRDCFIKGTKITLAGGSYKNCEDITFDDELLVWDFYKGEFTSAKPILIQKSKHTTQYNKLTFSDGTTIGYVGHKAYHRIFNQQSGSFTGTATDDTPIGTITFKDDKTTPTLVSKGIVNEDVEYYNIITDKYYNCFTNGILASCRLSNQYQIEGMKYIGNELFDSSYVKEYIERIKNKDYWIYKK